VRLLFVILMWSQTSLALADRLVPAKLEEQSPREELRKQLFSDSLSKQGCKVISKNPGGAVPSDASLTLTLQKLIAAINNNSSDDLLPIFHPQLKVSLRQAAATLTAISRISGKGGQASLFRAYAINNATGEALDTICEEDGLIIKSLYGHMLQVAVWIQVQGQDEVSRVYADLIPSKEKWLIGAWNVQQWTHTGKDFSEWKARADEWSTKKQNVAAWLYYDIAIKLLDGGKFLEFPVSREIATEQKNMLGGKSFLETINPKFPGEKIVYASSLFSRKGAGVLLRFGLEKEWSANAIREHCRAKFSQLSAESWMNSTSGLRCDYILPNESPNKEGSLGGMFIDQDVTKSK